MEKKETRNVYDDGGVWGGGGGEKEIDGGEPILRTNKEAIGGKKGGE